MFFLYYFLVNRIVSAWNSLPDEIVTLTSLGIFKYHLDKFCSNQETKYDSRADMAGAGTVSLNSTVCVHVVYVCVKTLEAFFC